MAQTYNDDEYSKLSKIKIGNEVKYIKDAAVRAILDTYGDVVTHNMASSISDTDGKIADASVVKAYVDSQVGSINKFDVKIYDALPEASKDTMFILALIAEGEGTKTAGSYIEYITVRSGAGTEESPYTYAWEQIGTTEADLTDYVKKTTTIAGIDLKDNITATELEGESALNLKALSHKDSASGTVSTIDAITFDEITVSGDATVTTTDTSVASTGKFTAAGTVSGTVVPTGTVSTTVATADADATLSTADYTPEGSVSITLSGNSFKQITDVGTLPTYTAGSYTAPSVEEAKSKFATEGITATMDTTDTEMLVIGSAGTSDALTGTGFKAGSYTAPTYTAGTLPTAADVTVGVSTATFTGTKVEDFQVTGVSYKKSGDATSTFTGNASGDAISATFAGTPDQEVSVSGTYAKANGTAAFSQKVTPSVKEFTKTDKTVTVQ